MNPEKIKVRMENGQSLEVVVLSKRAGQIQIVLGQGVHSVKCDLVPTRNDLRWFQVKPKARLRSRRISIGSTRRCANPGATKSRYFPHNQ